MQELSQNKSLFFCFFFLVLFFNFSGVSLWKYFRILGDISMYVSAVLSILVFLLSFSKYKGLSAVVIILSPFLLLLFGLDVEFRQICLIWCTFVLIISAKGIKFQEIVKFHFFVVLCFCILHVVLFELGLTEKYIEYLGTERIGLFGNVVQRLNFGYVAPTDFATHVFYILLDYWILKYGRLKIHESLLYVFLSIFVIVLCDARQAAGCILLILICSCFVSFKKNRTKKIGFVLGTFLVCCVPLFAIISIYASAVYNEADLDWILADLVLSGRLSYGYNAIQEFGIPWMGQTIEMIDPKNAGAGVAQYNYVDNSYLQFLLRWGIVMTCFWVTAFVSIAKSAYKRQDIVLLFVILLASISSVITQFLFHISYCVLLLALMAIHNQSNKNHYANSTLKPAVGQ